MLYVIRIFLQRPRAGAWPAASRDIPKCTGVRSAAGSAAAAQQLSSSFHVANVAGEKSYVMLNSSGVSVTMDTGTNTTLTPEVGVTLAMKNVFKVAKNFLQIILSDKGKNT